MSRRTHKKSRTGCARCKKRHIKCDETRPGCVNCSTANLECEYAGPRIANLGVSIIGDFDHRAASSSAIPTRNIPTSTSATVVASSSSQSPAGSTPASRPLYGTDSVLNLDHLELLHHFCTVTYKTMSPQSDHQETWQVGDLFMLSRTAMLQHHPSVHPSFLIRPLIAATSVSDDMILAVLTHHLARRSIARPLLPFPPPPNPRSFVPPPVFSHARSTIPLFQQSDGDAIPRPRRLQQHAAEHRPLKRRRHNALLLAPRTARLRRPLSNPTLLLRRVSQLCHQLP